MPRSAEEIAAGLRERITSGELQPGDRLPTMQDLADEHGVNRNTASKALTILKSEGLAEYKGGRAGTVVRDRRVVRIPFSRYSKVLAPDGTRGPWETATHEQGLDGRMVAVSVDTTPAPDDVAQALDIDPGTPAVRRSRHATIGDTVVQIQHAWYPPDIADTAGLANPGKVEGGVFGAMAAVGLQPAEADETVTARMPSKEEAEQLSIGAAVPVLLVERVTRDRDGQRLELLQIIGAADRLALMYDKLPLQ
ncbi:GntR family transcriptional regulator [Kitasatospora sp. A2-31]|uniref:GntR family transcriptional regulator n=1 Tax=Kitasatospora sp. A2-31 TaxID=2916414 RepID=UPI001EEBCE32|nr:GntR family transcriptional regulator [Kitasatospora sp. A2-31]MCG6497621.1 GntR family transcriptional regulator [Kitasatospora sp. A2-31]